MSRKWLTRVAVLDVAHQSTDEDVPYDYQDEEEHVLSRAFSSELTGSH